MTTDHRRTHPRTHPRRHRRTGAAALGAALVVALAGCGSSGGSSGSATAKPSPSSSSAAPTALTEISQIEPDTTAYKSKAEFDTGAEARALLRNNVEALGLGGVTRIFRRDATHLGPAHPVEPFSLVFLDPPYGKGLGEKALASLQEGGWLAPGALLIVEEAKAAAFVTPEGFEELERRAYDDTEFVFLRTT